VSGVDYGEIMTEQRQVSAVQLLPTPHGSHHLTDYLRTLYRRRWIAAAAFIVVFGHGAINSLRTEPVYQARVQIVIEKDPPKFASLEELFAHSESWFNYDFYETQYKVLQSRTVARRTLQGLGLWTPAQPVATTAPAAASSGLMGVARSAMARFRDAVTGSSGQTGPPATGPAMEPTIEPGESADQTRKINAFLASVTVSPVRNSRLVDLKFESGDPVFAARAANMLAHQYIEHSLEFKSLASKEAGDWLTEQLEVQRQKVAASEAALQRYKETHDAVAVDDRENIVVQKLADLNTAVTRAKTERIQKEAVHKQLEALRSDNAPLDTFPAVLANSYIQEIKVDLAELRRQQAQLADTFGDKHPEMIRLRTAILAAEAKLEAETAKVVDAARSDYLSALALERSLSTALDSQKAEALRMNRKGIEYGVLLREAASDRQVYESLLQRAKEAGISKELRSTNIRVLDAAEVPLSPVRPDYRRELGAATVLGLLAALGLAFFFEYLDNRIRTPDELKRHLSLPFLGMVPVIRRTDLHGEPLLNNGVPGRFAEALFSVRTSVLFSSAEEGARSVVVTSTSQGEGKTVVATNLAIALAQTGQRVILVDGDLRRPQVHRLFDQPQEPGLSNIIVGSSEPQAALHSTDLPGLFLMTAGHTPPNPADLLGSPRFRELLEKLKGQLDWIVIDSPPVLAVTDASVLAHQVTGVIFVIGTDMVSVGNVTTAIEQLQVANARFLGTVLNKVDLDRHGYYYATYYRRRDRQYYEPENPANTGGRAADVA
jgi:capsular exopolysaccharide synthesis family protein